jgi:hypothetical protein
LEEIEVSPLNFRRNVLVTSSIVIAKLGVINTTRRKTGKRGKGEVLVV